MEAFHLVVSSRSLLLFCFCNLLFFGAIKKVFEFIIFYPQSLQHLWRWMNAKRLRKSCIISTFLSYNKVIKIIQSSIFMCILPLPDVSIFYGQPQCCIIHCPNSENKLKYMNLIFCPRRSRQQWFLQQMWIIYCQFNSFYCDNYFVLF